MTSTIVRDTGPPPRIAASPVRLSFEHGSGQRGSVDGTWWPHSSDAAAELPALIEAVDERLDRVTLRVGLHVDAWNDIPHRFPARGRQVRVGWFRSTDPRLITLIAAAAEPVVLMVVRPPADRPARSLAFLDANPLGGADPFAPTVIRLSGEIGVLTAHKLRERLLDSLRFSTSLLILDLSDVSLVDASGLAVIVGIQRRAKAMGITLALSAPCPYVSKLLRATGLDRRLPLMA
jgi:anti-anti-sigma factor